MPRVQIRNNLRVGIIHSGLRTLGGAEQVAISLIKGLKSKGHEIDLYLPSNSSDKTIETVFKYVFAAIELHKVFHLKLPIFGIYVNLINRIILTKAGDKNDVVIETSGALDPLWLTNSRYIAYCNGLNTIILKDIQTDYAGPWRAYWYLYSKLHAFLRRRTNHVRIISNSEYTRELVKRVLGIDSEVVYPPVSLDNWFCSDQNFHRDGVVTISRFSPEKNLIMQIEIMKHLSEIEFKIIANLPEGDMNYYKNMRNIAKSFPNITFHTGLSAPEIIKMTQGARVFLNTSIETFGIAVVEAIAAGCIPIVPDHSAHKETVPFSELRFVNVDDARKKIRNAIEGKYDYLIPRLQEHIKQFHEKSFLYKMINLIESV